ELVLNVEVKNTAGQILKYYPVEIRGDAGTIPRGWKVNKKLERRTDANGRCIFTEVPDVKGLKVVLYAGNKIPYEPLSGEAKRIAEQHEKEYFWGEVPVEVAAGQKEYDIEAVALTEKEHNSRKRRKK
ncbi:MAG: hypothetical protein KAR47_06230, partial [Planctomycetes bacterium]|nr:hypothetical protein [Planctomycetota bacterium]